jgi:hypothetical protein
VGSCDAGTTRNALPDRLDCSLRFRKPDAARSTADPRGPASPSCGKKAISLDEIATFREQLIEVIENMTTLMIRMEPIYMGPKRKLVAKIKELQQKVAQGVALRRVRSVRS